MSWVDFKPPDGKKKTLIAVLVSVSVFILAILGLICWKWYLGQRISREQGNVNLKGMRVLLHKESFTVVGSSWRCSF